MREHGAATSAEQPDWPAEVARLKKIITVLMDRAERSTTAHGSDFAKFQSTIMLEQQVRTRTAELEIALRENEQIERALLEATQRFERAFERVLDRHDARRPRRQVAEGQPDDVRNHRLFRA